MLRYKTETRPGLVALYDIRPGNGAGPFLQPRSLHGAPSLVETFTTNSKHFKAFDCFSKTTREPFQFSEIQGLFTAGLEVKPSAGTGTDVHNDVEC